MYRWQRMSNIVTGLVLVSFPLYALMAAGGMSTILTDTKLFEI